MKLSDQTLADEAATASCGDYPEPNEFRAEFLALAEQTRKLAAAFSLLMSNSEACAVFDGNARVYYLGDIADALSDIEGDFNRAADAQEDDE